MKILLALDDSPRALVAVRHVLQLWHEGLPLSLVLANVQAPAHLYELVMTADTEVIDAAAQAAGEHALAPALTLLQEAGVRAEAIETVVGHGEPATVLVELAESFACDQICMGTHGSGWLASTRLGRVATAVLQQARCSVLVARDPEPEEVDDDAVADTPTEAPGVA